MLPENLKSISETDNIQRSEMKKGLMAQEERECFNKKNLSKVIVPRCYDLHKFFCLTWTNLRVIVLQPNIARK